MANVKRAVTDKRQEDCWEEHELHIVVDPTLQHNLSFRCRSWWQVVILDYPAFHLIVDDIPLWDVDTIIDA
jgi:hypothetical protein